MSLEIESKIKGKFLLLKFSDKTTKDVELSWNGNLMYIDHYFGYLGELFKFDKIVTNLHSGLAYVIYKQTDENI